MECAVGLGITPIQPDLTAPQTLSDLLADRDSTVEALLALKDPYQAEEQPDAPLSRGRFTALLRQASGQSADSWAMSFSDLFPIFWYTPDVNWAAEQGIVNGVGSGSFAASRTITWQEAAVMAERWLAVSGTALPDLRNRQAPQGAAAWAAGSFDSAWRQGLLPEDAVPTAPMTREEGQRLADLLRPCPRDIQQRKCRKPQWFPAFFRLSGRLSCAPGHQHGISIDPLRRLLRP